MAGAWMARTGVKALILDQKACRTQAGHADGIESRTLEILDSFGIGKDVWKKANRTIDLALWVSWHFSPMNTLIFERGVLTHRTLERTRWRRNPSR